jgi:hypothetical protein
VVCGGRAQIVLDQARVESIHPLVEQRTGRPELDTDALDLRLEPGDVRFEPSNV